jgi:hypothetical protein
VLNTVRQKHWRKTQLWGLHKTQGGSEAYAVPVDAFTAAIESGSGSVQISAEEFGGWQEASIEILGWCGLRPGKWCNFPVFERRIVDVRSHRGMVSE